MRRHPTLDAVPCPFYGDIPDRAVLRNEDLFLEIHAWLMVKRWLADR